MKNAEIFYFKKLKLEIEKVYKTVYTDCKVSISDWKVIEIRNFQELMQQKVNSRISEKWFYTHLKNENIEKLPRIDTLNLLSQFIGYADWKDFTSKNEIENVDENELEKITISNSLEKSKKLNKKFVPIALSSFVIIAFIIYTSITAFGQKSYKFSFVDSDTKELIESSDIEIIVLIENESPQLFKTDSKGCFLYETSEKNISFIVKAPYYQTDTVVRKLSKKNEEIYLKTDDYALMIHIFSNSKIDDFEKRKKQLEEMISDEAQIFQVDKKNNGLEMYNKEDFINKMIIPVNSLKNIKVIETIYKDEKIVKMRFIQEES